MYTLVTCKLSKQRFVIKKHSESFYMFILGMTKNTVKRLKYLVYRHKAVRSNFLLR